MKIMLGVCGMLVALGLSACTQVVPTAENIPGNYVLKSVDGKNVPCTVKHEGTSLSVKSGAFTINPDGTCHSKVVFALPNGGDAIRDVDAAYTFQGNAMTMKWKGAGTTTGTFDGNWFTMNNEGMAFAYKK